MHSKRVGIAIASLSTLISPLASRDAIMLFLANYPSGEIDRQPGNGDYDPSFEFDSIITFGFWIYVCLAALAGMFWMFWMRSTHFF